MGIVGAAIVAWVPLSGSPPGLPQSALSFIALRGVGPPNTSLGASF